MRPTLRAVLLFALGIPVALAGVLISGKLWTLWLAYASAAIVLLGLDWILGTPRRRMSVASNPPASLFIGDPGELEITLTAPRHAAVDVLCDLSGDVEDQEATRVDVRAGDASTFAVPLVPTRRGRAVAERLWLRWTGPLGLASRSVRHELSHDIPIVPNIRGVRAAALRFFSRDAIHGMKIERYTGDGSAFESLREHVPGMDLRSIDWKHTARHRKLLSKEFRAERNHQVIVALDTGRLMSEHLEGVPKLDHAINAGLLLSYVSLRSGDRVGMFGFDAQVRSFSAPAAGVRAFRRLQASTADLEYSPTETNFTLGLSTLGTHLRRRSLVILLTDFVDTITAELMIDNVHRLSRRHLVVFVTLRHPQLDQIANAAPRQVGDVYRSVVASDMATERNVVLERLRRLGVHTIDIEPERVSSALVNRYLEIVRREMI
jgi:uncharacterized protein (DUF58 family)